MERCTDTETEMKQVQRETDTKGITEKDGVWAQGDPASEAKACGLSSAETQQERMQLPIRKTFQRVKDTEIFKLADDGARHKVLSGESEVPRLCPNFIIYLV